MSKITFQVGDIIQCKREMLIYNEDDTEEEVEIDDIFMIIGNREPIGGYEYELIHQKSLKISTWDKRNLWVSFKKV